MPTLTLQFVSTRGLIPRIIRTWTNSDICHVDAVLKDGRLLGSQLHEKDGDGVLIRDANYEEFTKKFEVQIDVTQEQYELYWKFLYSQLGKPYDNMAILGLVIHRDWRETNSWFCSELIAAALEYAGILKIPIEVNWVDPQTLRTILCSSPLLIKQAYCNC